MPGAQVELCWSRLTELWPAPGLRGWGYRVESGGYIHMMRTRHPRKREPDVVRAVVALFGLIVLPILLMAVVVLLTAGLVDSLIGI